MTKELLGDALEQLCSLESYIFSLCNNIVENSSEKKILLNICHELQNQCDRLLKLTVGYKA